MNDEQRVKFEAFLIEHDSEIGHGRYHKYHPMYPDQYFDYNAHIAWLAWQAAQQVKPLAFVKTGDYDNSTPPVEHYSATTEFGIIELIVDGDGVVRAGFLDSIVYDRDFTTLTKAIEAANEDYRKRALSCLVWGWGDVQVKAQHFKKQH